MSIISQEVSLREIREKRKCRTAVFRVEVIVLTQHVVLDKSLLWYCILVIRLKMLCVYRTFAFETKEKDIIPIVRVL